MVRLAQERVLLIGDTASVLRPELLQLMPPEAVTSVESVFDGIAEMGGSSGTGYTAIMAAVEPIERRPEAAVRALRDLAGDRRLILFGSAATEVLSRKMLKFGCDDYLVLPAGRSEILDLFGIATMRLEPVAPSPSLASAAKAAGSVPVQPARITPGLPLSQVLLDALLQHPHDPVAASLRTLNDLIGPALKLIYEPHHDAAPPQHDIGSVLSRAVRVHNEPAGTIYLLSTGVHDESANGHWLAELAHLMSKTASLQDRHNRLQKLAITDELTGLYNARYFRHFLSRIVDKARQVHFPVTLLLFDIDDFKKYNDHFGHGVGDEILKQTSALMKRCTRDHDLVARIGGDEFAVVFWDKEGPRQPLHADHGTAWRPPQTPIEIFKRFQKLLATQEFPFLGQSGKGVLGISAGMAVYPYEAHDVAGLIAEADRRLMQLAKKNGKNTIYIVGTDDAGGEKC